MTLAIQAQKSAFWFCCLVAVCLFDRNAAVTPIRSTRAYKLNRGVHRAGVTPREAFIPAADAERSDRGVCGIECFVRNWCRAFNINHLTGECELFDATEAEGSLEADSNVSFFVKISADVRTCDGASVVNGEDIEEGTEHDATADIKCNATYGSEHASIKCDDGNFKTMPMEETVTEVICHEDCGELLVANGTDVAAGTPHGSTIEIQCNAGLATYYESATCTDGVFSVPSRILCGDFPATGTYKYQGQFMKVYNNPTKKWIDGIDICVAEGGIAATALSPNMLDLMRPIIPYEWNEGAVIGLKQKDSQATASTGWQWIEGDGSVNVVDIDTSATNTPQWFSNAPDDFNAGEDNEQNTAMIYQVASSGIIGINDIAPYNSAAKNVLCQLTYPWYEFKLVGTGRRVTFPLEKTVVAATLELCTEYCINSVFCRAFSYSTTLGECHHHSTSPTDRNSTVIDDTNYNIYA